MLASLGQLAPLAPMVSQSWLIVALGRAYLSWLCEPSGQPVGDRNHAVGNYAFAVARGVSAIFCYLHSGCIRAV